MAVECIYCGKKMKKLDKYTVECPHCGIEAEFDVEDDEWVFDDLDDGPEGYDDIYDEKPECCLNCGGNYPDCMDSCDIFDD